MTRPFFLSSTAAADNPSLLVLREMGFELQIRCYKKRNGTAYCLYIAMMDDCQFTANSGAELLGLVTLWKTYGREWNKQEPDIMTDIIVNEDDEEDE